MTTSTISTGNLVTRFQKEVKREYVREGPFGAFVGNDSNAIIQTNDNLKKVSLPLIAKIRGPGVSGSTQLSGSEVALSNYAQTAQPTYYRQGVLIDNEENEKAEFDLFSESRPALMNWTMELVRDQTIQALGALDAAGVYYNYGGTSGAFGATAAGNDPGVYFSHRSSAAGVGRMVFNRGNAGLVSGSDSAVAFSNAGGTVERNAVLAYDAPTGSAYLYRDGVLVSSNVGLMTGGSAFVTTTLTQGARLGGVVAGTVYASQFRGWQAYIFSAKGLPLNIGRAAAMLAESPSTPLQNSQFVFA